MVNVVAKYVDGVGNKADAIQWDGTPETLVNIKAWTKRASLITPHNVLRVQTESNLQHCGVGDWLVMDSHRQAYVFPEPNSQFVATYVAATP